MFPSAMGIQFSIHEKSESLMAGRFSRVLSEPNFSKTKGSGVPSLVGREGWSCRFVSHDHHRL